MAQQAVVTNYFTRKRQRGLIQPSKRQKVLDINLFDDPSATKETLPILCVDSDSGESAKSKSRQRQKIVQETPKSNTNRVTRSTTKKLKTSKFSDTLTTLQDYFSPTPKKRESTKPVDSQSSDNNEKVSSPIRDIAVVTAADDNHNIPTSPGKRPLKSSDDSGSKRNRISPKKKYSFEKSLSNEAQTNFLETAAQKPKRNARKRLPLANADGKESTVTADSGEVSKEKPHIEKLAESNKQDSNNNVEAAAHHSQDDEQTTPGSIMRTLRSNSKKEPGLEKSKNLAEKLLAKKKENPEALRKALKGKGNLKDLQDTLLKMRDLKKQESTKQSKKKSSGQKLAEKDKPSISTDNTAVKKREYAYSRLHSLAQEIPKGLSLPYKYKILQDLFRSADTIVSILFNRQETATWPKVQQAVKDMIRRKFEQRDLGQIKHVFPGAYRYRQEKGIPTYSDHVKNTDYQLTLEPLLNENDKKNPDEPRKLTSGMLVERRHHFHLQILDVVKQHHQDFLATLDPPVEVNNSQLRRWHPQFPLDQVPDIPLSELPAPPEQEKNRCSSAKDVLDKARDRLTKKAVDALRKVAEKCGNTPEKSSPTIRKSSMESNNNETPTKSPASSQQAFAKASALKGVSQSLLAKIREKEAEQKMRNMIRSDAEVNQLEKMKQLPEVARSLRMLFITEKKTSLPMDYVSSKLAKCCPSVATQALMDEHLRLLSEHTKPWLTLATVRKQEYAKLDKNKQLSDVLDQLQGKVKEAERS